MGNLEVASTILAQLGGNRFRVMTGANSFVGSKSSLMFRLPRANKRINRVRIELEPSDTYKVEFYRVWGGEAKLIEARDGIYCDMLERVVSDVTGLATRL